MPGKVNSGKYRIAVAEMDQSDRTFMVEKGRNYKRNLKLKSFSDYDTWYPGKARDISWEYDNIDDDVKVYLVGYPSLSECADNLQINNEANMVRWPLANVPANIRSYKPVLPDYIPSGKYKIVLETPDGQLRSESSKYFNVRRRSRTRDISVQVQPGERYDGYTRRRSRKNLGFDVLVTNNAETVSSPILVEYSVKLLPLGKTVLVDSFVLSQLRSNQSYR